MSTPVPQAKAIQAALNAVKQRVKTLAESWSEVADDNDSVKAWAQGFAAAIERLENMRGYVADPVINALVDVASKRLEAYADESWVEWGRRLLPELEKNLAAAKAREAYTEKRAQQFAEGAITEEEFYAEFGDGADDGEGSEADEKMEVDDGAEDGAGKGKGKAGSPIEIEDQTAEEDMAGGEETPVATPKRPTRLKSKVAPRVVKEEAVSEEGDGSLEPVTMSPPCAACVGHEPCMMIPKRQRCQRCAVLKRRCSLKPKEQPSQGKKASRDKKRKTGDSASVASGSQTSETRRRLRKTPIKPDPSPLPSDDDELVRIATDAILLRGPASKSGLINTRDTMRWRLEGNARELRVLLKERAVAQAELDRVRELLREIGVDDDDGSEEEDEDINAL